MDAGRSSLPHDLRMAGRDYAYDDLLGTTEHRIEQLLAPLGRALLRVVEEAERPHLVVLQAAVVEENSRDDERACETAASRLIGAGDQSGAQLPIEAEELLAGAQRHGREDTRLLGRLFGVRGGNVGLCGFRRRLRALGGSWAVLAQLADACLLPDLAAEVVELRAVHVADRGDLDPLDLGGMQRERSLDSHSKGLLAD